MLGTQAGRWELPSGRVRSACHYCAGKKFHTDPKVYLTKGTFYAPYTLAVRSYYYSKVPDVSPDLGRGNMSAGGSCPDSERYLLLYI